MADRDPDYGHDCGPDCTCFDDVTGEEDVEMAPRLDGAIEPNALAPKGSSSAATSLVEARAWLQEEANEVDDLISRMAPALQASYREKSKPHNALAALNALERAYGQACTNLAVGSFRGKDISLAEESKLWHDALLAGWAGIQGWPDGE